MKAQIVIRMVGGAQGGDTKAGLCRVGMYLPPAQIIRSFSNWYLKLGNPTYTHVSPLGNLLVR